MRAKPLVPLWLIGLIILVGYAMAMTCQLQKSLARGADVEVNGNFRIIAPNAQISSQIARKLVRQPSRRVTVQVRQNANAGTTAVAYQGGVLASIWVDGSTMADWLEGIAWGLSKVEAAPKDGIWRFDR